MSDEEVYEEVTNDPSTLESTIFTALNKIRARGDFSADNFEFFSIRIPILLDFICYQKFINVYIMFLVPVISNCGYYAENKSSILDYHLQVLAKKVESYIKDTNHFLKKLKKIGKLPKNAILCWPLS